LWFRWRWPELVWCVSIRAMAGASGFVSTEARSRYAEAYDRTLATAGVPLRAHDVPTGFGLTHIVEAGEETKPPLVLLHTMSFSATVWVRNLAGLSRHYRVLAIDTIGDLNLSRSQRAIGGRDDYVEWFSDVLAALGIARVPIAGNSYGGWLAANFALLRPEMVSRIVLISPPVVFTTYRASFYAHVFRAPFIRSEPKAERFGRWFVSEQTFADEAPRRWLDQFSVGMPYFRMRGFPWPKALTDEEVRSITVPVLLIEGEDEPIHNPRRAIERAEKLLASVRTTLLPATKHVAELEHPDRINHLILDHLAGAT
jgi:pimeloyl-ACP methyl ester carboxylesterase